MKKSCFVSIDLDYWSENKAAHAFRYLFTLRREIKPKVFVDHHEMLNMVNRANADILVNIDWHSDIIDYNKSWSEKPFPACCGSWVNHVKNRSRSEFLWIMPHRLCDSRSEGRCDAHRNPFGTFSQAVTEWKKASKVVWTPNRIPQPREICERLGARLVGCAIASSPDYTDDVILDLFSLVTRCQNQLF